MGGSMEKNRGITITQILELFVTSPNLQLPPFCVFKNATFMDMEKTGVDLSLTPFFFPLKRSKISAQNPYC